MQGYFNLFTDTCTYTVTPSIGINGSVSPNVPQTVGQGGVASFSVFPNAGYAITMGGTCVGTLAQTWVAGD